MANERMLGIEPAPDSELHIRPETISAIWVEPHGGKWRAIVEWPDGSAVIHRDTRDDVLKAIGPLMGPYEYVYIK